MIELTYLVTPHLGDRYVVYKFDINGKLPKERYHVAYKRNFMRCSCPHNSYRNVGCKHIEFVKRFKETGVQEYDV